MIVRKGDEGYQKQTTNAKRLGIIIDMKAKYTIRTHIFTLVIGVVILGAAFVAYKTYSVQKKLRSQNIMDTSRNNANSETENTYVNDQYSFNIMYPSNTSLNIREESGYVFSASIDPSEEMSYAEIKVSTIKTIEKAVEELKNQYTNNSFYENGKPMEFDTIEENEETVFGQRGYKIKYELGPNSIVTYIIQKGAFTYYISARPENIKEYLSGFKFTE